MVQRNDIPLQKLHRLARSQQLYAILDAVDAPIVPSKVKQLGEARAVSLFKGGAQEDYWALAPYLAQVDVALLRWIFDNLWQQPWGVFLMGNLPLQELHAHLNGLLIVKRPDRSWLFRYYDPRVLEMYLPACNETDLERFFGPLRAFGINKRDGSQLWRLFTRESW